MSAIAHPRLPDYLRRELGRGQATADVPRLVAQLELFGLEVQVWRLQLGDMRAERFGEWREVYRTKPKKEQEHANS